MNNSALGDSREDVRKELFTPEKIAESDLRVSIIGGLIKARQEKCSTSLQLNTILKVLTLLGKTLAVVPLETGNK